MERKDASFVRSAGLLSFLTLISRVLGLVREAVCAYFFGAGELWGDFSIAFRIPNLSRRLFGEGALSAAFIPVLSERLHRDDRPAAARLVGQVLMLLAAILLGLVIVGETAIWIARQSSTDTSLSLTAVMLPYMFFICLVALLAGAHNVMGSFGTPAVMPILFNVFVIGGAVIGEQWAGAAPATHVHILAGTVVFAGFVQLVLQWWTLSRSGLRPVPQWNPGHPDIRRIAGTMAPMIIGLAAIQLNSLADMLVAKVFVEESGGAAVLSYAERLYQLPIGVFGAAIATAIFPQLAKLAHSEDRAEFARVLSRGVRLAVFVGLPASVGLLAVRQPVVRVLYERGEFTAADTIRVAPVVGLYGLGVWAYIMQQVLVRGYYSLRDTRTPLRIAGGMVVLNLALNLLLVQWYAESGIAAATAVCAALQAVLLATMFAQSGQSSMWRPLAITAGKALAASVVMILAIWAVDMALGDPGGTLPGQAGRLVLEVALGAAVFVLAARLLRCEELDYLLRR